MENTKSKFYEFSQNNSGGYFDVDEDVCHRVIIEATSANHAISIFEPMIEDQSPSCPCCGDRWSIHYNDEINLDEWKEEGCKVSVSFRYDNPEERWFKLYGEFPRLKEPSWQETYGSKKFEGIVYFDTIEQHCQFLANAYGWTTPDIRIHYLNGSKKEFFKPEE